MASTEWVLSDDWKLWRDAQWGSRMNPFRVLRSAAFNTVPWEKLFAPFESFSCRFCYLHPWRGDRSWWSGEQANRKMVYLCCFFFLSWENVCCFVERLFIAVCSFTSLTCLAESKSNLIWNCFCTTTLHGLKLSSRCTLKKKKTPNQGCQSIFWIRQLMKTPA